MNLNETEHTLDYNTSREKLAMPEYGRNILEMVEQMKAINEPIVNGEPWSLKQWEEATEKVQAIQTEWRKIGFAPKKHNQSIYEAYRAECDRFFATKKEFFLELRERRKEREQRHKEYLERQKAREQRQKEREEQRKAFVAKGGDSLRRMHEKLKQEVKTAENNILFFTAKSKTANALVDAMQKKIEDLKKQLAEIEKKMDEE